jgi:lysozyme
MRTSDQGIEFIKKHEGFSARAYPDPATGGEPWTIAYGHTGGVRRGDVCDEAQADFWLRNDIQTAEDAVNELVTQPITQSQFDALVDFIYNVGVANFAKSTLLKKINGNDFDGALNEFVRWDRAGGREMAGLKRRREEEANLFMDLA